MTYNLCDAVGVAPAGEEPHRSSHDEASADLAGRQAAADADLGRADVGAGGRGSAADGASALFGFPPSGSMSTNLIAIAAPASLDPPGDMRPQTDADHLSRRGTVRPSEDGDRALAYQIMRERRHDHAGGRGLAHTILLPGPEYTLVEDMCEDAAKEQLKARTELTS